MPRDEPERSKFFAEFSEDVIQAVIVWQLVKDFDGMTGAIRIDWAAFNALVDRRHEAVQCLEAHGCEESELLELMIAARNQERSDPANWPEITGYNED